MKYHIQMVNVWLKKNRRKKVFKEMVKLIRAYYVTRLLSKTGYMISLLHIHMILCLSVLLLLRSIWVNGS